MAAAWFRALWSAWISNTGKERTPYDPDEIDYFFVIDGDFDYYLIPAAAVGGLTRSGCRHIRLNGQQAIQPDQPDHDDHRAQRVR